jgi:hypothetical protein
MNVAEHSHEPRQERRQAVSAHVNAVVSAKVGARDWMTVPSTVSVDACGVRSRLMQTASLKVFMVSHAVLHRRSKYSNPGVRKKTCVSHEDFVCGRVYREGVGSVMGVYFV